MPDGIQPGPESFSAPPALPDAENPTSPAPTEPVGQGQGEPILEAPRPDQLPSGPPAGQAEPDDLTSEAGDWEEVEEGEVAEETVAITDEAGAPVRRVRRRRRPRSDAAELRLLGRRALCKRIADIAPYMLRMVKLRILGRYLQSTRGLEDDGLTQVIRKDADKLAERSRVLSALNAHDPD
ncbi:MAG TPA: hypothetical protein VIL46_18265, partial [Gemmataceae bacterium]